MAAATVTLELGTTPISYARHQFPPDIIRRAVSYYLRLPLK
jgi:transposase-like protein